MRRRFVATLAVTLFALFAARAGSAAAIKAPVWEVYALRYATVKDFPIHALVAGADTTRKGDIAMMFWLITGPGHRVLFDAGFYRQKFLDDWKPAEFMRPSDVVQKFGIPPDSITDVVISHVHWDHLDGADLFPNAKIWIQRAEYEYYVGAVDGFPLHSAIDTVDAQMLASLDKAGRVTREEGDSTEILPGIRAFIGGKHTFASQYLTVRTKKATVVLASDNMYLYENLDKHVPIAQTLDKDSNLAAQDRMKRLASSARLIVPGHDPAVFQRFKKAGDRAVKIE